MPDIHNDLRIDHLDPLDDPRLTAFALDELDDPADVRAVEAILAESAAATAYVDDVRQAARTLTDALRKEPSPGLDPRHRDAIEEELMPSPHPEPGPEPDRKPQPTLAMPPTRRSPWARTLFALAAVALIAVGMGLLLPQITAHRESARLAQMEVAHVNRHAAPEPSAVPSLRSPAAAPLPPSAANDHDVSGADSPTPFYRQPQAPAAAPAPATPEEQYRRYAAQPSGTAQGYGAGREARRLDRFGDARGEGLGDQGRDGERFGYKGRGLGADKPEGFADSAKDAPVRPLASGDRNAGRSEGAAMGGMTGRVGGGMGMQGGQAMAKVPAPAGGEPLTPFRAAPLTRESQLGRKMAKAEAKDSKQAEVALMDRTESVPALRQRRAVPGPPVPGPAAGAAPAPGQAPPAALAAPVTAPLAPARSNGPDAGGAKPQQVAGLPAGAAGFGQGATGVNGPTELKKEKAAVAAAPAAVAAARPNQPGAAASQNQPAKPGAANQNQPAAKADAYSEVEGRTTITRIVPGDGLARQVEPAQQAQPAVQLQLAEQVVDNEDYARSHDNPFLPVRLDNEENRLSTFSIDVDTASYSNMRRFLNQGAWPPKDSVRIEEFVNYFTYSYPQPTGDDPFSVNVEVARCPWKGEHRLVRVGLKGRDVAPDRRPNSNLVFLVDVSGSMSDQNKLPLVKTSLRLLVDQLGEGDRVAIVTYAGTTGVALPSTPCTNKDPIVRTIERLESGGSTNGGAGLNLAYDQATANFLPGGVNRVILCTDGDFNTGLTDAGDLVRLVEDRAKRKVSLSVMGFGMGNLKDALMEQLADKGDGNYAYIDTLLEARKHLVEQLSGTLVTIAKDVKVQVEFNPARVAAYRLIGYEDRLLNKEDFDDDTKDAGEIGAGHTVTALYEVVPVGAPPLVAAAAPALRYGPRSDAVVQDNRKAAEVKSPHSEELLTVALRYKAPDGDTSKKIQRPVVDAGLDVSRASDDFKFAAAVASFGMILRGSPYRGDATLDTVLELARAGRGADPSEYRREFIGLVEKAKQIRGR